MISINKLIIVIVTSISLVGCKNTFSKHIKCDDESANSLVTSILKDDLKQDLDKQLKNLIKAEAIKDLDPSKLKITAESVQYSLADSRTDFIDPNSPKSTCSIDLTVTIPSDVTKKANEANAKVGSNSVEDQASNLDVKYNNNKINLAIEYELQPTDKGDKTFARVKNTTETLNMKKFLSDTLLSAFLKPQIEKNQIRAMEANKVPAAYEAPAPSPEAPASIPSDYYEGY